MGTGKTLLGMLAGIAAGALIGVLLAPEKGTRMRKRLLRKGEDLKDSLTEKIDEKFEDLTDAVKSQVRKAKMNMH